MDSAAMRRGAGADSKPAVPAALGVMGWAGAAADELAKKHRQLVPAR